MKYFETRIRTAKFGLCNFQSMTDRRWVRSRPWTFGPGGFGRAGRVLRVLGHPYKKLVLYVLEVESLFEVQDSSPNQLKAKGSNWNLET